MNFSQYEQERYSRHLLLEGFGTQGQGQLKHARVLVIGAGGLGCPALLYLAAAGVGHIGIVDDDAVSLSNLQRQVLYTVDDLGLLKALAAKKRLSLLNDAIEVEAIVERVAPTNVLQFVQSYDLVIDGTDNFATRYLINDACVIAGKPFVYGAIFKFEGQVSVFNLGDGPTYRCLFPEPESGVQLPGCNDVGVLGVLPGLIGTWQAAEAIKVLTGIGKPLKGKLQTIDLLTNEVHILKFPTRPENKQLTQLPQAIEACRPVIGISYVTLKEWQQQQDVQLIDVREEKEYHQFNIGAKNIPLSQLQHRMQEIDEAKLTVVHCQSGVRSKKAISLLQAIYPSLTLYQLTSNLLDIKEDFFK